MNDEQLNPWSFNPINLSARQIGNPFLVIADFFSSDDVPGHLRELLKWRSCVLEERYYIDRKGNPSGLLFTYQLNINLIESMHLLLRSDMSEPMMTTTIHSIKILEQEKNTWLYFPDNLNQTELLNPFMVIKEFFKTYTLPQYRNFLYEWLEYGLSSKPANEFIETADLINVYEKLQKLYSAAWLINQRTTEEPYLKTEQTIPAGEIRVIPNRNSLYQLDLLMTQDSQQLISRLISVIKHKLETVQAVIYLGTQRGISDIIFLLIITANEEQRLAQALSAMIEETCRPIAKVVALTHHQSFLTDKSKENNLFVRKALNCPVIYLSGDLLLPVYGSSLQIAGDATDNKWERWNGQGKDFLNGATFYIQNGANNPALFSLHQSAECFLIAIIRAVLGYRINSHNLHSLLKITQIFTNDLIAVFDLEDLESKRLFDLLQHAYVNVRYKDNFETEAQPVSKLLMVVNKLMEQSEQLYRLNLTTNNL